MDSHLYSMPPHAGFGLGIERVISRLLGITVKESAMFIRDPERLTP
jgi:aspartyl-tRNA synthetase